ncbi:DUF6703 family protein [Plantactinospora sp. KLBMP9567]|uniref:DUF6703 family protein n=1 Tax=Plantactinospora sp. KLBMP9567 TaxID=3085900 RepID=UPI002981ADE8|nr:DUF6703 family protein [Plantactinospora sp. KLBMP9567]MDW5327420.1 DUF6703 family protein [Plantactinospora sp. KLBMP9567]
MGPFREGSGGLLRHHEPVRHQHVRLLPSAGPASRGVAGNSSPAGASRSRRVCGMQRTQSVLLTRLARVNPTGAFLAALVLVLVGLFAPGIVGGALLLALAAGLAALLVTTWPVQSPPTRILRLVILTLLVGAALMKILG